MIKRVEEWGDPEAPLCINCAHYKKPHYTYYQACLRDAVARKDPIDGTVLHVGEHCPMAQRRLGAPCGPHGQFFKQAIKPKPLKWWQFLWQYLTGGC